MSPWLTAIQNLDPRCMTSHALRPETRHEMVLPILTSKHLTYLHTTSNPLHIPALRGAKNLAGLLNQLQIIVMRGATKTDVESLRLLSL